jgi:hypothetical protein
MARTVDPMERAQSGIKPGRSWPRKYHKPDPYFVSGPPRDIAGAVTTYEEREAHRARGPEIRAAQERDTQRFLGSKQEQPKPLILPEQPDIPINQRMDWYVRKAFEFARLNFFDRAYWYFRMAADKAKKFSERNRWMECANSNLREWQRIMRVA